MTGSGNEPGRNEAGRALDELLDAYGADPERWPADDPRRAAAWASIDAGDGAALQSLTAARALDRALDSVTAPAPSAALAGAVLQAAQRPEPGIRAWAGRFRNLSLLKPAGALACAALLGIAVGVQAPVPIAGVGKSQAAGLETEMASLGALEVNGDDSGFGEFAE